MLLPDRRPRGTLLYPLADKEFYGVPTISPASHFSTSGTTMPTIGDEITAQREPHPTLGCTSTLTACEVFLSAAAMKASPIWSSG